MQQLQQVLPTPASDPVLYIIVGLNIIALIILAILSTLRYRKIISF